MELKVVCDCGQKLKFDVEPVNGRMPVRINCPACGADATEAANRVLAGASPTIVIAAPPSGLRINRPAPAPVDAIAPPPAPEAPTPVAPPRMPGTTTAPKPKKEVQYSLGLGILGALLGTGLGAGLMYGFFALTEFRFPLMGTSIGLLTGLGARILSKGTDMTLGAISGTIAFLVTGATLYFMFGEFNVMFLLSMAVSVSFAFKIAG